VPLFTFFLPLFVYCQCQVPSANLAKLKEFANAPSLSPSFVSSLDRLRQMSITNMPRNAQQQWRVISEFVPAAKNW
jgi:hypothetical protein